MISVVVPIYNEEEIVVSFHKALASALESLEEPWEVLYINDGSRDASLPLLLEIKDRDPRVVVVELSRNFGHQPALTAGLHVARGDAVVLMDGDFQDPPEVVPKLVAAWKSGAKVVVAQRSSRAERGLKGTLFALFYKLLGLISDFPIPLNAGIFGLLDRQAVDAINNLQEGNRYLPGLRAWVGFPTVVVLYDRAERPSSKPKQTFLRLFKYAMDAIFSFSFKPLRVGLTLGTIMFVSGFGLAAALVLSAWFKWRLFASAPWNKAILFFILTLGGVQLICMGLLGEYIGRIYDEVRRRPLYVIHEIHQATGNRQQAIGVPAREQTTTAA
ncbi:MAG TPA: glycosyltransferase [Candidatus Angelobacter sp.]